MPGSVISRHAMIAPERSARSPDDDMAWTGTVVEVGDPIVDKDEALQVLGGCEPLDDPLAPPRRQVRILCPVVEVFVLAMLDIHAHPVRAAPSEPGLSVTITHGVRMSLRKSFSTASLSTASFSAARRPSRP
jgi:hypothetical protein